MEPLSVRTTGGSHCDAPARSLLGDCRVIERPNSRGSALRRHDGAHDEPREVALIDEAFARRSRDEWMRRLKEDPGDFIYTIVNTDDLADDPQVLANDYVVEMEHPQHGPTKMVGVPVGLSETPGSVRRAAPELGQDTEMVLMDVLGWDWDRIRPSARRKRSSRRECASRQTEAAARAYFPPIEAAAMRASRRSTARNRGVGSETACTR